MRVAIVHYWLVTMRGGEKVVAELCRLWPDADLFTHVLVPEKIDPAILKHRIATSFIARLPFARKRYKTYLPLMPLALEEFDLSGYDLIVSSEAGPAKGVVPAPGALHVCYVHSPMRYVWNMYHGYRAQLGPVGRVLWSPIAHYLRGWDQLSAARVDLFVANSANVADRIRRYWGRDATVVHPPVAVADFTPTAAHDGTYLLAGQLVGYKRADLAVEAFNRSGRHLVVIGDGEQTKDLRRMAGPTVEILGPQPFAVLHDRLARCRALIFPGEEDFGIVPVEAMASGKPVIAYGRGGALETVVDGLTGLFFHDQTSGALNATIDRLETGADAFDPTRIAHHATRFDAALFRERFGAIVEGAMAGRRVRDGIDPYPDLKPSFVERRVS
jgi:glycosyltransferase involved in cell wall biosynthesis